MAQIGYNCTYCNITILEDSGKIQLLEDEAKISANNNSKLLNDITDLEYSEQEKELKEIASKLKKLADKRKYSILNRHMNFNYTNTIVSLHTGDSWYVFSEKESKEFIPKTKLFASRTHDDKPEAYFSIDVRYLPILEYRYVQCPLCKAKNYLPLTSLILR